MNYVVPFYKPTYLSNLSEINRDNFFISIESAVKNLESRFLELTNCSSDKCNHTLAVSNTSSAIHLSMCAIDLKRGDKVICAVNSYVDIPEAIRHFDSEPLFTDIEPETYHMSIDSLRDVVSKNKSKKLRAIVVTHFAGLKQDMSEIMDIAKANNLLVIEDFTDRPNIDAKIDVSGDIGVFSLNYKLDNTIKGAVLTFKSDQFYDRASLLREHGLKKSNSDVSYLYDIEDIGCDYRLDSLNAFLLNGLVDIRDELIAKKREVAEIYFKELEGVKHIKLPIKSDEHPYSYFVVEVDKNRDAFARELKALGIEVGLHYIPLNFTKYYKQKYGLKIFSFPNALSAYQKVMSLPCNGKMSKKDALLVVDAVKKVASKHI